MSRGKYKIWALYFSKITSGDFAVAEKKEMIPRRGNWSDLCLWRKFHWNFFFSATHWNRLLLLLQTLCEKARSLYSRLSRTRKAFKKCLWIPVARDGSNSSFSPTGQLWRQQGWRQWTVVTCLGGKAKRLSTDSLLFYFSNVFLRLDSFLPPVIYFSNREPRVYYTEWT